MPAQPYETWFLNAFLCFFKFFLFFSLFLRGNSSTAELSRHMGPVIYTTTEECGPILSFIFSGKCVILH